MEIHFSRRIFLSLALFVACTLLLSCGGGSSSSSSATVSKITVTPSTATIPVGQTFTFFAAPVDSNNNALSATVTWASSSTSVATIDATGKATALSPGSTQVSATFDTLTSNTVTLTVTQQVASVTIAPMSGSVKAGNTLQFSATALDSSGKQVTGVSVAWFCSFSGIATIDQTGLVTGVAPGTVTVVATVGNVSSQPATVTVTQ